MFGGSWLPRPPNTYTHSPDTLPLMGVIMSLRNQPYLPLYVNDVLTDEKLMYCSEGSQGVYFRLLCWLHKQQEYGVVRLRDEFKLKDTSKEERFAQMLSAPLSYPPEVILRGIRELETKKVINITEETLYQKRMIADAVRSKIQAENRSRGRRAQK